MKRIENHIYLQHYLNNNPEEMMWESTKDLTEELKRIRTEYVEIQKFKIISEYNELYVVIEKNQKRYIVSNDLIDNEVIKLKLIDWRNDSAYCYFYGKTLDDDFPEALIRFYINCKADNTVQIVKGICKRLDKIKIPFSLKCFKDSQAYFRSDNIVLYVYKYDWSKYFNLLRTFFEASKGQLNSNVPLFTYPVCHGVGFGENPNIPEESFGSLRCKFIGNSILKSIELNFTVEQCLEYTQEKLIEEGFDLEKFYLNPRSRFPYNFN